MKNFFAALICCLLTSVCSAKVTGLITNIIITAATSAEMEETIFDNGVLVLNASDYHDVRAGNGKDPGGVRICRTDALTAPPPSYPYPLAMNGNAIALNGSYSIGAEGPLWFLRANGSNVISVLADANDLGSIVSLEYAGSNILRVVLAVEDGAADPLVQYTTNLFTPVWTDCVYTVTNTGPNTLQLDMQIPEEDAQGYFRITSLSGFRVRFGIPLEAPSIETDSLTLGGRTWTNLPESLAETDPVWLAERSNYATGTPLYAYTETDPVWLAERSNYATGTPLYAYTETDPVWIAERSNYATGIPLYAYTEADPAFTNWLDTNAYIQTETDPVWISEKSNYATGTPLYVETIGSSGGTISSAGSSYSHALVWNGSSSGIVTQRVSNGGMTLNGQRVVTQDALSNYATGAPLYAFTETDPAFTNWLETNGDYVFADGIQIGSDSSMGSQPIIFIAGDTTNRLRVVPGGSQLLQFNDHTLPIPTNYGSPYANEDVLTHGPTWLGSKPYWIPAHMAFNNSMMQTDYLNISNSTLSAVDGTPQWINGATLSTGEVVVAYDNGVTLLTPLITPRVYDDNLNGVSGSSALAQATNCTYNGVSGSFGMFQASNCTHNSVSGDRAMYGAAGSDYNGVSGGETLFYAVNCDYNGASGYRAMYQANNCTYNGASGESAMRSANNCHYNGVSGYRAMYAASGCNNNGVSGYEAMYDAAGSYNGVSGYQAMYSAKGCNKNGVSGNSAMQNATNCENNIVGGYGAMTCATGASNSLAAGAWAGRNATGMARGYIDCYTSDPGDAHNPTNDLIYFDNGALYFGRGNNATNRIVLRYLPTSDPGFTGQLWQSGSNLYISTGP